MKVLITGVTGYIGSHLATTLAEANYTVEGTSRDPARRALPDGVAKLHRWSTAEPLPADAIDGADAIVLLTGEWVVGRWTNAKKRRLYDSRVVAARNVVSGIEAARNKPSVLIGGSAVGYYGNRADEQLTEESRPGDDWIAGLATEWESTVNDAQRLGVRVVNTRTGLVVGKGCPFLRPQLPIWKLGLGGRLGSGRQWWPWVHVQDLTKAIKRAIEDPHITGPINIASPGIVQQRDFSKALAHALHRPAVTWVPSALIEIILGEMSGEVLNSKRVVPRALMDLGFTFAYTDVADAVADAVS